MSCQITLTHAAPVCTAVISGDMTALELSRFVPAACGEVWNYFKSVGLPQPGRHVAVYHNARGTVEAGAEVAGPFEGNERVRCSELPSGRVATATHHGPYGRISETHTAIREWCRVEGLKLSGICWEIYGHWQAEWNEDPSKIQTDVFYLLQEEAS